MAADLVESSGIKQTFVHDLELFFWVLLWIVLTQVEIKLAGMFQSAHLFEPRISAHRFGPLHTARLEASRRCVF